MRRIFCYFTFILSLAPLWASAAETDNFTHRQEQIDRLKDAGPTLDAEVERRLAEAVKESPSCDSKNLKESSKKLTDSIYNQLSSSGPQGKGLEGFANNNLGNRKLFKLPTSESIYRDDWVYKLWTPSPTMIVHGVYMGTDKMDHFFSEGHNEYYRDRRSKESYLLKKNYDGEQDGWGKNAGGVASYADLMANYQGFSFWKNVTESDEPYFNCENGQWKRTSRAFTLADYVNPGFDEGLNCSDYSGNRAKNAATHAKEFACPVDTAACYCLSQRFSSKEQQQYLISPQCRSARSKYAVNCAQYANVGSANEKRALSSTPSSSSKNVNRLGSR